MKKTWARFEKNRICYILSSKKSCSVANGPKKKKNQILVAFACSVNVAFLMQM